MSNILIAILLCLKLLRLNVQTKNFFAAFPVASNCNVLFLGKHKTQPLELGAPKSGSNSIEFSAVANTAVFTHFGRFEIQTK